jgi:hypothetical protein
MTVVPEGQRQEVITRHHELGHFGADQTIKAILKNGLYWKELKKDVTSFIAECDQCLRYKVERKGFAPARSVTASYPMEHIAMDLGQPTLKTTSSGNNFFLIIVDVCTRFVVIRAISDKAAVTVAWKLWQIFADFGVPRIIQSDNGTEFNSAVARKMAHLCGYDHRFILPRNPRANGVVEAQVKQCKQVLFKKLNQLQETNPEAEWDSILPAVQMALNAKIARATNSSPMELLFARPCYSYGWIENKQGEQVPAPLSPEAIQKRNRAMVDIVYPAARIYTERYQSAVRDRSDKKRKLVGENDFKVGTIVMMQIKRLMQKSLPKYSGPYRITRVHDGKAYLLDCNTGIARERAVPFDQMKWVSNPVIVDQDQLIAQDEQIYTVEAITNHRLFGTVVQYLVKWMNYPSSDSTWEPLAMFIDKGVVQDYWQEKGFTTISRGEASLRRKR